MSTLPPIYANKSISFHIYYIAHLIAGLGSSTREDSIVEFLRDHVVDKFDYNDQIMVEYFQPLITSNKPNADMDFVLNDIHNCFRFLIINHLNFANASDRRTAIQQDILHAVELFPSRDERASLVAKLSPDPSKMYEKLRGLSEDIIKEEWHDFMIEQFNQYMAHQSQTDAQAILAAYMDMSIHLNMEQPKLQEFTNLFAAKSKEFAEHLEKKYGNRFDFGLKDFTSRLLKNFIDKSSPWQEGEVWERLLLIVKEKAEGAKQVLPSGGPKKAASGSESSDFKDLKDNDGKPRDGGKKPPGSPKGKS